MIKHQSETEEAARIQGGYIGGPRGTLERLMDEEGVVATLKTMIQIIEDRLQEHDPAWRVVISQLDSVVEHAQKILDRRPRIKD